MGTQGRGDLPGILERRLIQAHVRVCNDLPKNAGNSLKQKLDLRQAAPLSERIIGPDWAAKFACTGHSVAFLFRSFFNFE